MGAMRAFLAVDPEEVHRRQIARIAQELRAAVESDARRARVTWVRPEAIHLTVRFFGDIDEHLADPLRDAVLSAVYGERPYRIPLTHLGAFPRMQVPRALWIGPAPDWQKSDEGVRLSRLVQKIDDACSRVCAAPVEPSWRPHLTLARVRAGERDVGRAVAATGLFDRPLDPLDVAALRVTEIALVKSELRPTGPVHTRLWTIPSRQSS